MLEARAEIKRLAGRLKELGQELPEEMQDHDRLGFLRVLFEMQEAIADMGTRLARGWED